MSDSPTRPSWIAWALGIFPLALFASGGTALWLHFHHAEKDATAEQERFAQQVSEPMVADDLKKIVTVIGERNASSPTAAANLTRTASMIEGLLGPTNTGYQVQKTTGPSEWPLLQVTLSGTKTDAPPVWVITSYDSRAGSPGVEANATGLAATLAAAQALAREKPGGALHFVFLPHVNDPDSPVIETAARLQQAIKAGPRPAAVLCIEAMGAGDLLWLSSRDTTARPLSLVASLGSIHGAETICLSDDVDLASSLFEMELPAVRVATRAMISQEEQDASLPDSRTLAVSTGRLIELIRRCLK